MESKQLIIFDLDGTLVDSCKDLATAVNLMRAHFKIAPIGLETIRGYVGNGVRPLVQRALQGADINLEEALKLHISFYRAHLVDETALYPGVFEVLKHLRARGHVLAVATNKPAEPCDLILSHVGIADWFVSVMAAGRCQVLKPEPDMIHEIMKIAGVSAENTWMVGDNYTDLEAARHAGVRSIFLTYGYGTTGTEVPTHQVDSFEDLMGIFTNELH